MDAACLRTLSFLPSQWIAITSCSLARHRRASIATAAIEASPVDLLPRVVPAHRIGSDQGALDVALTLAAEFRTGASERDRERRLPWAGIEKFSASSNAIQSSAKAVMAGDHGFFWRRRRR
ncbi:hypothetical protein [Collimonas antrihumi]|uniref:hypothetical protein n=1 Tax=Collimonas antrihumi TaxID=1940615 RepID=UPI001B8D4368|nr:hypothetical protein [Collimonas antrihumi]